MSQLTFAEKLRQNNYYDLPGISLYKDHQWNKQIAANWVSPDSDLLYGMSQFDMNGMTARGRCEMIREMPPHTYPALYPESVLNTESVYQRKLRLKEMYGIRYKKFVGGDEYYSGIRRVDLRLRAPRMESESISHHTPATPTTFGYDESDVDIWSGSDDEPCDNGDSVMNEVVGDFIGPPMMKLRHVTARPSSSSQQSVGNAMQGKEKVGAIDIHTNEEEEGEEEGEEEEGEEEEGEEEEATEPNRVGQKRGRQTARMRV